MRAGVVPPFFDAPEAAPAEAHGWDAVFLAEAVRVESTWDTTSVRGRVTAGSPS